MIGITINGLSPVGQLLTGLAQMLDRPDDLLTVLAREGNNRFRTWFRARDQSSPNQLGGERTHFWAQIADSVSSRRGGAGRLIISITDPRINQKIFGGDIVPKNAKALTIPVKPEAYGRRASVFEESSGKKLFLVIWKQPKGNSIGALCLRADPGQKTLNVIYVLMSRVHQDKDPDALPPQDDFQSALIERARNYVGRLTNNPLPGAPLPA